MYDAEEWRLDSLSLTLNWAHSKQDMPEQACGDAVEVSRRLFRQYMAAGVSIAAGPSLNAA
jgi:hypothetical protein